MLKQELIDEVQKKEYQDICKRMLPNFWKDLYQELNLIILEYDEKKLERINNINGARFFLVGILCKMVGSTTSPFYRKFRNSYELEEQIAEEYNTDKDEKIYNLEEKLENIYWFDKEIFKQYTELGSIRKVVKKTGISFKVVYSSINKTKKSLSMKPINILLIATQEDNGLKYHRQIAPHKRLLKTHPEFRVTLEMGGKDPEGKVFEGSVDNLPDEALKEFNIVYYLRQISFNPNKVTPTIERLKGLGIKTILDIDDNWRLNSQHLMYQHYKNINVIKETEEALKQVDHVITTTDYFADSIRNLNPNITVLPNCINPDDPQFIPREIPSPRVRFGWIGGVYHLKDIEAISETFCRAAKDKEIRDSYQVCLGGYNYPNREYQQIEKHMTCNYEFRNYDSTYTNYLFTQTSTGEHISYDKSYRRLWGRDVNNYGELYNEIDVALIPLIPNKFNKCKSELKLVEAGTMGKTVIVSDTEPYSKWIKDGVNGLKISPNRNNIDWYLAMKKLIKEPQLRKDLADGLKETIVENFNMDKHNQTRAELYKSLV